MQSRAVVDRVTALEIWVKLLLRSGPIMVCSIYRQWTNSEEEDIGVFHRNLREYSANFDRILVAGDLNLDWARRKDVKYYRRRMLAEHCCCLEELDLIVANELDPSPTYRSHAIFTDGKGDKAARESVLDHLLYHGLATPTFRVLPHAITDHRPILATFELPKRSGGDTFKMVTCRNFKSIDASICWLINSEELSGVFYLDDVESIHRVIVKAIVQALDEVAPERTVQVKERRTPLYLRPDTLKAISERDRAAGSSDHTLYRRLRNRANRLVRRDKLDSNAELLSGRENSSKAIWDLANTATGRAARGRLPPRLSANGSAVEGDAGLANFVNTFYLDKIARIRGKIDGTATYDRTNKPSSSSSSSTFRFRPPSDGEVLRVIMGLNNTRALGIDGIPVVVLKALAPIIAPPMGHLIRRSFAEAVVPSAFKMARVTPVYKGGGKVVGEVASYRPISILPAMSKVLERAALRQLSPHLAPLLPPSQFGFRPRRSTSTAILSAQGSWAAARARGKVLGIAGYDMSAAFDTVDAEMLALKLEGLGVRGEANRWFRNYLQDRFQRVDYNGAASSFLPVPYGVPQGSILGPVLFLVLVSDLPQVIVAPTGSLGRASGGGGSSSDGSSNSGSNNTRSSSRGALEVGVSGYADDVAVWVSGNEPDDIRMRLEQVSQALVDYCGLNYLAINSAKTQIMWSGCEPSPVRVGETLVQPSPNFEFLGVSFDRQLSVAPHLANLITSARSLLSMSRRLRHHLPRPLLKMVMQSMVRGRIGYACAVLPPRMTEHDPQNVLMHKLQVSLNDVARSIIGCSRSDKIKVEELLQRSGMPSLNRMVVETIGAECWKALRMRDSPDLPLTPLGQLLDVSSALPPATTSYNNGTCSVSVRKTRAGASGSIPPPTKIQVEAFTWWAYRLWNSSMALRTAPTLTAARSAASSAAQAVPF